MLRSVLRSAGAIAVLAWSLAGCGGGPEGLPSGPGIDLPTQVQMIQAT